MIQLYNYRDLLIELVKRDIKKKYRRSVLGILWMIFNFYVEATNTSMGSILENSSLIKKVYVPKYIFPLARVLSSCVNFVLSLPGLFLMLVITNVQFKLSMFLGIIPVIYVLFFCFGIGLLLSTIAVYFRDMFHLYGVLITALSYLTPLFYPKEIIPEQYKFLIDYNPLYYFVSMFREIYYYGKIPVLQSHLICILIVLMSLSLGVYVFFKNQKNFILHI